IFSDKTISTIIHEDRPSKSELHPTMKPIKLLARLIRNSSREKETVLDVFGGSGSTLIACEQLNRNCYMMEIDPKYCDVIIKRWEALTGEKAVKVN
ncbi:MAG TPA: site-specific DNA-methyltransferase, partial [Clostridiales bacterium]|nr:site-specific DNA-methyltransferase [Clostridiales bacterium]